MTHPAASFASFRRLLAAGALVVLILLGPQRTVQAKTVTLEDGRITFEVPDDFTQLTPDEIAKKFPMRNGVLDVYGNANRGISVSYTLTRSAVRPEQLGELKESLSGIFAKVVPNAQWIQNDYVTLHGTRWIILELVTPATGTKIHNIEIATSYRGVAFIMNFNADIRLFDAYQDRLLASLHSVTLKDDPSLPPSPSSQVPVVSAEQEVERGEQALRDGNPDLARKAFNVALFLQPGQPTATRELARLDGQTEKTGKTEESETPIAPAKSSGQTQSSEDGSTRRLVFLSALGAGALLFILVLAGIILYFVMRPSRQTAPAVPKPINRPPPLR